MNKLDLLRKVSEKCELSQEKVNDVLKAFVEVTVTEVRDNGEQITLPGLGMFRQKIVPAHEGFNPLKKEKIHVEETRNIQFKVQSSVKVKG